MRNAPPKLNLFKFRVDRVRSLNLLTRRTSLLTGVATFFAISAIAHQNPCGSLLVQLIKVSQTGSPIPQQVSELFSRLDREIPPDKRTELTTRWNAIQQKAARLRNLAPGNILKLKPDRITASRTMTESEHAAVAQQNWEEAEAFLQGLVDSNHVYDLESIETLNQILTKNIPFGWQAPGRLRTISVSSGAGIHVEGRQVPLAMDALIAWLNSPPPGSSPIERAARAWQAVTSIHPFTDGNGRTGRFLMDWILLKEGLPPVGFLTPEAAEVGLTGATDYAPGFAETRLTEALEKTLDTLLRETD